MAAIVGQRWAQHIPCKTQRKGLAPYSRCCLARPRAWQTAILRLSVVSGSCVTHNVVCYRCGASLASLPLPLSRRDECPQCTIHVHVCKMCRKFDPAVPRQCREDDAEDVVDKEKANFCEWFDPSEFAFDPALKSGADAAQQALESLFSGDDASAASSDDSLDEAEKLFR